MVALLFYFSPIFIPSIIHDNSVSFSYENSDLVLAFWHLEQSNCEN